MKKGVVAEIKKEYLRGLAKRGKRISGREPCQCREMEMEVGIIETADGSARVRLGDTDVLVTVMAVPGDPLPETPDKGRIVVTCKLLGTASTDYQKDPPCEEAVELAEVVRRGIVNSDAVELGSLCIEAGAKVWVLHVNIDVLDHCGNLFDAAGAGALCALGNTVVPASRKYEECDDFGLNVIHRPIHATFVKMDGGLFLDPDIDEERGCMGMLVITTDEDGELRTMQKLRGGRVTREEIEEAIEAAVERGREVRRLMKLA